MSTKELETKKANLPAFIPTVETGAVATGFENANFDDYSTPFIRILQPNSPQLVEEEDSYIKGAKPGMFFNTITGALYGKEIKLIVVSQKTVYLAWAPNQGGFRGEYSLAEGETIGTKIAGQRDMIDEEGNDLVKTMNFYVIVNGHEEDGLMILSLASTGMKHAKKWMTMMNMLSNKQGKTPMYAEIWKLSTVLNKNDSGSWFMIGSKSTLVEHVSFVNESQYALADEAHGLLGDLKVDYGQLKDGQDGPVDTGDESGAGGNPFGSK